MKYGIIVLMMVGLAAQGCTSTAHQDQGIWIRKGTPFARAVASLQQAGFERQTMNASIPNSQDARGFVHNSVDRVPIKLDIYVHHDGRAVFLFGSADKTVTGISYFQTYSPSVATNICVQKAEIDLTKP